LNIFRRIRASVSNGDAPVIPGQEDSRKFLRNFLLHFRPASVPERSIRFSLTLGLGVAAVTLVFLLLGSGLLLKFVYEPTPAAAYNSILQLNGQVPFGRLLRNMHRWSGYGLLLVTFLHFLRAFYTSAFLPPRQFNWIIGLVLFVAVGLSNFTGYLLPWDQISYWAVTISTSMLDYVPWAGSPVKQWILGGTEPGPATLLNFYAIHTAILPVLLLFMIPFHFWRIRKANGLVLLRAPGETPEAPPVMVKTVPHLVSREAGVAMLVVAAVVAISMVFNAPLAEQANPGLSPNPTKAPWYFMGIQEILMHFHPFFAVLVIPALMTLGLVLIPYLRYDANTAGVWFVSEKGRKLAWLSFAAGAALTIAAVLLDDFVLSANTSAPANVISNGLAPFLAVSLICIAWWIWVRKVFSASRNEAVQAMFTLLVTSFVVLTLIGIWFRGPGMQLTWAG
jgi:quinol-cytochrome oxidoreductase complex cytochrome b subunit